MLPVRVQKILFEFVGIPVISNRCRSHTQKGKMCSRNSLNGSFFCRIHSDKLLHSFRSCWRMSTARKLIEILIHISSLVRVKKYKYPPSEPEPFINRRIITCVSDISSVVNKWGAARVIGYDSEKGLHNIIFDNGKNIYRKMKNSEWIYSRTLTTKLQYDDVKDNEMKRRLYIDRCRIYKYITKNSSYFCIFIDREIPYYYLYIRKYPEPREY